MYLYINDMLIKDKDIKKFVRQEDGYVLKLVENDNPKFVKISFEECSDIYQKLNFYASRNFYQAGQEVYYVPSIYDIGTKNGTGYLYYQDGSVEKVEDQKDFQSIKNLYNRCKNQEDYQA